MQAKITILMGLVESFVCSMKKEKEAVSRGEEPGLTEEALLDIVIPHFQKKATDSKWYQEIQSSFRGAIAHKQNPLDWLSLQFNKMEMFKAGEVFQNHEIPNLHCMSFVYLFFNDKPDDYFCNFQNPIHKRCENFLLKNNAKKVDRKDLQPGDIILYYKDNVCSHIGIFIGVSSGKLYAVSKFGTLLKAFMHPIEQVPDLDGSPVYFRSDALVKMATKKLSQLGNDLLQETIPKSGPGDKPGLKAGSKPEAEAGPAILHGQNAHKKLQEIQTLTLETRRDQLLVKAVCSKT